MKYLVLAVPLAIVIWLVYGASKMMVSADQTLGASIQRALE